MLASTAVAKAVTVIAEVERATRDSRSVAAHLSLPGREVELMTAAFDSPERQKATAGGRFSTRGR